MMYPLAWIPLALIMLLAYTCTGHPFFDPVMQVR